VLNVEDFYLSMMWFSIEDSNSIGRMYCHIWYLQWVCCLWIML